MDLYQKRYLDHQEKKKKQLTTGYGEDFTPHPEKVNEDFASLLKSRRSQRVYNKEPITTEEWKKITKQVTECPSSCNRQPISLVNYSDRDDKQLLCGLLVGAVGWAHRADSIVLMFADWNAYKENLEYMPYLDAGAKIMTMYLVTETLNIGCAYINPNIRESHVDIFNKYFKKDDNLIFTGAFALGKYDRKAEYTSKV